MIIFIVKPVDFGKFLKTFNQNMWKKNKKILLRHCFFFSIPLDNAYIRTRQSCRQYYSICTRNCTPTKILDYEYFEKYRTLNLAAILDSILALI